MEAIKTNLLHQCCQRLIKISRAPFAILVITILCLLFLGELLVNNGLIVDVEVKSLRHRLAKLDKDLEELRYGGNQTWTLEQYRRKDRISKVCQKYGNPTEFQQVKSFIMDPKVGKFPEMPLSLTVHLNISEPNHILLQPQGRVNNVACGIFRISR